MKWSGGHGGNTLFIFHAKQHSVEVGRTGHYFIYLDLKLNCTSSQCGTGRLEVEVRASEGEPVLTCSVNLHKSPVSQKCWQVFRMDQAGTRLVTRMHVLEGGPGGWALDTAASGQGIFPVGGAS
ncbi:hypothetical protein NHX12_017520 [Muraenolepis orangiensis]|uniref:Uncharacterized protein n=1 Tax=Muraenolepis orangiensis TaxID=630683 RepID=A0A9Q0EUY2_9TELE|nr:hypothetical protein NHX12_017520 [Muraenolepis orangiensis]